MGFQKWRSINKFSDVFKLCRRRGVEKMQFRGKIKLHGTNAAIRFENGEVIAQKRSSDVTIHSDNAGFANWVATLNIPKGIISAAEGLVFYGEWAGPGVQKSDAVTEIPQKTFFVFSVVEPETGHYYIEPQDIQELVTTTFGQDDRIKVIPWETLVETVNMLDDDECNRFLARTMERVDERIAKEDPYIKLVYGISGAGEGLVFYPLGMGADTGDYLFKCKTESHSVNKGKSRTQAAPAKPEGMDQFIDDFFTEARFEQILQDQLDGEADRRNTGIFLKGVMSDVHKESSNEVELADFDWKDVPRYATPKIKNWFFKRADQLG